MFPVSGNSPSAHRFLLHLFHLQPQHKLLVQQAIAACAVMGISANNARVTLARLCRSGLVELIERGCYALSPKALMQKTNAKWIGDLDLDHNPSMAYLLFLEHEMALEALPTWQGDYFMVSASFASSALAQKSWLWAVGFRPLEPALFVRPNTLALSFSYLEAWAKQALGSFEHLFLVSELDAKTAKSIRQLYPVKRLEQGYRHCIKALEKGNQVLLDLLSVHHNTPPSDKVLRECYELLERCDVLVHQDPCLPSQWLDLGLLVQCLKLRAQVYQKAQHLWDLRLMVC